MQKFFIAGGAGFIGSHLTKSLLNEGHEVVVFDNNIQYFYPMTKYSIKNMEFRYKCLLDGASKIRGNTLDVNFLRRKIIDIKPDYIINLAALPLAVTAVKNSEEAYKSILDSTHNFMEVLKEFEWIKKYVHISSSMIYGDFMKEPNPENAIKEPKDIYGSMKLASEYLVKGYSQLYDIKTVIIRPSAVYGPTDNNYRVLQKFVEAALDGHEIIANNPSTNRLDFSYVEDTANGIKCVTLADTPNMEVFNITRGEGRTIEDAIKILQNIFPDLKVSISNDMGFYPKRGALDIKKLMDIGGYIPKYSLEKGLQKYIDFMRS